MIATDPEERSGQLAEYVLGTLAEDERTAIEQALPNDPTLRAELLFWREKLLGLATRVPVAEPSAALWPRIAAATQAASAATSRTNGSANKPAVSVAPTLPLPWWQRLRVWQGLSGVTALACAALVALLVIPSPDAVPSGARYLAVLQSPESRTVGWVVEARTGGRLFLVPLGAAQVVPEGRALQFWTKAQGAAGPTSLGLVAAGQRVEMPASALPTLGASQLFEITLEPANGSPIGRPTGPILFVGTSFML